MIKIVTVFLTTVAKKQQLTLDVCKRKNIISNINYKNGKYNT